MAPGNSPESISGWISSRTKVVRLSRTVETEEAQPKNKAARKREKIDLKNMKLIPWFILLLVCRKASTGKERTVSIFPGSTAGWIKPFLSVSFYHKYITGYLAFPLVLRQISWLFCQSVYSMINIAPENQKSLCKSIQNLNKILKIILNALKHAV